MVMELHRGVENARAPHLHACRQSANSPTLWSKTTSRYQCVQNYGGFETGVLLFVNGAIRSNFLVIIHMCSMYYHSLTKFSTFTTWKRGGRLNPWNPNGGQEDIVVWAWNFQCSTSQEKRPISKLAICTLLLSRTTGIMHTVWVRLNAVVFFGLTVLLGLSCLAALSKVGHSYIHQPSKFWKEKVSL